VPDGVNDGDESVGSALLAVRAEYAAELPALLATLAALVEEAAARPEAAPPARLAAHRLRGTAGSYGFAAVGEAAGRIEDALDEGLTGPALRALLAPLNHTSASTRDRSATRCPGT
jgi:HPt (histidine-containing phosphotransfer) domain-containing protein